MASYLASVMENLREKFFDAWERVFDVVWREVEQELKASFKAGANKGNSSNSRTRGRRWRDRSDRRDDRDERGEN